MKSLNIGMTVLMLAIFTVMVAVAATYPSDARFMPFVLGIPAIGLCLLQLFIDLRRKTATALTSDGPSELEEAEARIRKMTGRDVTFEVAHDTTIPQEEFLPEAEAARREKLLWGAFLGLIAGIMLFGFQVMTPAFIILFLRYLAGYTWTRAVVTGAIGAAIILGLFEFVLRNELFRGLLTNLVLGAIRG